MMAWCLTVGESNCYNKYLSPLFGVDSIKTGAQYLVSLGHHEEGQSPLVMSTA